MILAPCDWPIIECTPCEALDTLDPEVRDTVEQAAVTQLWRWTGQQYSLCERTLRPCKRDCWPASGVFPVRHRGSWLNLSCGACPGDCSCTEICEAVLPGPVDSVVEILLDGAVLPLDAVRVDDHRRLVRVDGGCWPSCQDLSAEADAVGTWQVTYMQGLQVPPGGQLAAGVLACELAKAVCGDDGCRLPKRVQTITRQGVTVGFIDDFTQGLTGIWEVDSWVQSVTEAPEPPRVFSPDIPRQREATWTG